jgi:septum formation protein
VLGSASPRRREILAQLGVSFEVIAPEVDESVKENEEPHDYLERIARAKLDAVMARVPPERVVLCADTSVLLLPDADHTERPAGVDRAECILGKPADDREARAMLRALSGRAHEVCTAFALGRGGAALHVERVSTKVWFRALEDDEVEAYVASGEGKDKAGGYAVQGLGAALVSRIEGSYTNVVGLPACEVYVALRGLARAGDG